MFKSVAGFFKRKYKKHKKWFLVLLALDILCIPVTAQIVDRVSFSAPQKVASVKLDVNQPGLQRFVVASNAPFAIISENAVGEFNVTLTTEDKINGRVIGNNAQLPGLQTTCAIALSTTPQKIYEAIRKTAVSRGEALSQAVIVDVSYDPALTPDFKFITQQNAIALKAATLCGDV